MSQARTPRSPRGREKRETSHLNRGMVAHPAQRRPIPASTAPETLLTMREVCELLHLGKTKVFELIHQEGLPVFTFGSAYRFDRTEVWTWMLARRADQDRPL